VDALPAWRTGRVPLLRLSPHVDEQTNSVGSVAPLLACRAVLTLSMDDRKAYLAGGWNGHDAF
jgi:hypothetical protein